MPVFLLALLLASVPLSGMAANVPEVAEVRWKDRTLSQAQRTALLGNVSWRGVAASLFSFNPRPEHPLILRSACTVDRDSAFFRDLRVRGATRRETARCPEILSWIEERGTHFVYTFAELQEKYLPIDTEAEAVAFFIASGQAGRGYLYASGLGGFHYVMMVESRCRGLASLRRISRIEPDGTPVLVAVIDDPPPRGTGCPGEPPG